MNRVTKKQQGFTLVELTLAMAFISLLLLAIALTVIQIGSIYNQGTTIKEVNQAARDMNDDLNRNISSVDPIDLSKDYVLTPSAAAPAGGRLCLGSYTYIWNYAKGIAANSPYVANANGTPVRFMRVADSSKAYCTKSGTAPALKDVRASDLGNAQELLKIGDHDLGIHDFSFATPVPASAVDAVTHEQLYTINYLIGTSDITALNATQTACLAPNLTNANPLFCDVEQFSLVVRAGHGVN